MTSVMFLLSFFIPANGASLSGLQWEVSQVQAAEGAREDELFRKMISRAALAYKAKRYREAITHFESALVLRPNPNIHWNLSVCYYKLKVYREALSHANQYLELGSPSDAMKEKVEARKAELLRELERRLEEDQAPVSVLSPMPEADLQPSPTDVEDQDSKVSQTQSQSEISSSTQSGIIWSIIAVGSFGVSAGVHLYADSIWASRPTGGGEPAEDARNEAITASVVGDLFLVFGLASAVVSGVYFFTDTDGSQKAQQQSSLDQSWGTPVVEPVVTRVNMAASAGQRSKSDWSVTGALLGWRIFF